MVEDVPGTLKRAEEAGSFISSELSLFALLPSTVLTSLDGSGYKVIKRLGEASSESFGWPEGTPQPNKAYCDLYSKIVMIQGQAFPPFHAITSAELMRWSRSLQALTVTGSNS